MAFPLRSLLFVPADDGRKMRRAVRSGADLVIFDLEDAVDPGRKALARQTLAEALAEARPPRFAVRVNAQDSPEHLDDLLAAVALAPDFVMLPKCAGAADLARLADRLDVLERGAGLEIGRTRLLPLVTETAASLAAMDYRGAGPRLAALVFGAEDLAADLGVAPRRADGSFNPLLHDARCRVVAAAAMAGVGAIDTPFPDPKDIAALARETEAAAELGFSGKLCIHPDQITPVHLGLRPLDAQMAWADAVIAALTGPAAAGVTTVDGRMVDGAHLRLAQRLRALGGNDD